MDLRDGDGRAGGGEVAPASPRESAWHWFEDFLCMPHDRIGRSGHVCPFVGPAMAAGTLRVEEWRTGPVPRVAELVALVHRMIDTFETAEWAGRNRTLHALVVVLPGLDTAALPLLDETHRQVKPDVVRRGLMLGQFHPACEERAVRNPELRVSRAPVPLFALRHMAFHDVLFLDQDMEWFGAYHARFGHRYASVTPPEPLYADRYARACEKWLEGCEA
ncbi:hypothetical protein FM076_17570 [Streptomyces albus subsp. chlorinus]|uniref:DUF6875 domain-containing protein n=1 Tax=Streptomyces albus TaxID=1888 RepID=UPI0015708230|nr:hypothetical protein [Streptomyces albus]NSC22883.1 hypothetical protein [Streptomyces albus subsp. chlorinus]